MFGHRQEFHMGKTQPADIFHQRTGQFTVAPWLLHVTVPSVTVVLSPFVQPGVAVPLIPAVVHWNILVTVTGYCS